VDPGTWCWNCAPGRPGAAIIHPVRKLRIRAPKNGSVEFLKALIFIAVGYGWAAVSFGQLPIR
jgi:hypothetical protein